MRTTLLACSAFALLLIQPALAQDNGTTQAAIEANAIAVASATSYRPIEPGATFDVSSATNSELADDTVELTEATLKRDGYQISRDAPYAIDVIVVMVRGVGQDEGVPLPTQGTVRGDAYTNADKTPSDDPLTQGNLFDTSRGALLTPAEPQQGGHLLRVSLSVYERKSGLYVWRGQVERDSASVAVDSSMQQMVPALLAHFGQSLTATQIPLR